MGAAVELLTMTGSSKRGWGAKRRLLRMGACGFALLAVGCGKERERPVREEEAAGRSDRDRFAEGVAELRERAEAERVKPREVDGCLVVQLNPAGETVLGPACVHVPGPIRLERGSLVVEPGTKVKMAVGAEIVVAEEAWLVARGTAEKPIVFESAERVGKAGDWKRLGFSGRARSALAHVVVRHGGGGRGTLNERGAVVLARPIASFEDVTIEESREHGLVLLDGGVIENGARITFRGIEKESIAAEADGLRSLPSSVLLDGDDRAILVESRFVLQHPATWRHLGVPYRLDGDLELRAPLTLTAGVVLEMRGRVSTYGEGRLEALGTPSAPVVWRSLEPGPERGGDFEGLDLDRKRNVGSKLSHLRVEYAGVAARKAAPILQLGEASSVEALEIRAGVGVGVHFSRCSDENHERKFCAFPMDVTDTPVTCGPRRRAVCAAR